MTLYIVPTPIGNLDDFSPRARHVLQSVDVCFAEDTRHSLRLFRHFGIDTRLIAFHDHSDETYRARLVDMLVEGRQAALISDAGTPCISDPGYRLVRDARARGVRIEAIAGPSALTTFLSGAGLPTDRFTFVGFLPTKTTARKELLTEMVSGGRTIVAYESPKRLKSTLDMLIASWPEADVVVARELTKLHETWVCGAPSQVRETLEQAGEWRGEIVIGIFVSIRKSDEGDDIDPWIDALLGEGLSPRAISNVLQQRLKVRKKRVYQRALARRDRVGDR